MNELNRCITMSVSSSVCMGRTQCLLVLKKTFISTLRLYNHHYQIYYNRLHTVVIIFLSIVYIYKRITLHIDGILANDTSEIHLQWMCSDFKGTDNGRRWITTFRLVQEELNLNLKERHFNRLYYTAFYFLFHQY